LLSFFYVEFLEEQIWCPTRCQQADTRFGLDRHPMFWRNQIAENTQLWFTYTIMYKFNMIHILWSMVCYCSLKIKKKHSFNSHPKLKESLHAHTNLNEDDDGLQFILPFILYKA
jgi:hypothetical protein